MKINWRKVKKILLRTFLFLFVGHILYAILCKWVLPPITITQLSFLFSGSDSALQRQYVKYENISDNFKKAVIAAEDYRYYSHSGFDWKSIKQARAHNRASSTNIGGSTISQQTAKNVFLWQKGGWVRKVPEIYFTTLIELVWSKERIFETYLNVVEMGEGIFGVEAASIHYFGKSSKHLSKEEAVALAICLANPRLYKPYNIHIKTITKKRYEIVFELMETVDLE
jgi:monofunctional glycosyltransferase